MMFTRRLLGGVFGAVTQGTSSSKAEQRRRLRVRPPRFFRGHHTVLKVRSLSAFAVALVLATGGGATGNRSLRLCTARG